MSNFQFQKRKEVRALGWVLVVLFCLFVLVQAVLYFGAPVVAKIWNSKSSNLEVHLGRLYINPLAFSVHAEDLTLIPKQEQKTSSSHIRVPHSEVGLKLWQSFRAKKFVVDVSASHPQLGITLGLPKPKEDKEDEREEGFKFGHQDFFQKILELQRKLFTSNKILIRRLELTNAEVNVSEIEQGQIFQIYRTSVQAETLGDEESSIRQLRLKGVTSGDGSFVGSMRFQLDPEPDLDLDFKLENLNLASFKKLFSDLAGIDPETGKLSVYVETKSENSQLAGYTKVHLSNLRFLSPEKDADKALKEKILEGIAESLKSLLENRKTGDVAWRMPIKGDIKEFETDLYSAAISLLRNAFVEALRPGLEGRVEFL